MTTGLHHVTGITRRVQDNIDFYAGFLGLRLVKQTGGFEDGKQLHLFYGDALGSPGSLVTFLVWEDGSVGRTGPGQVGEIAFAVAPDSIGEWMTRALSAHVPVTGPKHEFGEPVLRLKDPDGLIVKLVGKAMPTAAPLVGAPTRLRAVTLFTEDAGATAAFLQSFGYRPGPQEGSVLRMLSDSDAIDVRDTSGFYSAVPGAGTFDHVAFRAPDGEAVDRMHAALSGKGPTNVHDRKYFRSLYVTDPTGILLEYASDGPGFTVDEAETDLGKTLFVPETNATRAEDLRVPLPQFALPGEPRRPRRDLPFVHRFWEPQDPDGSVLLLLHGTGGNEASLMPLAHRIAPRATLLGLRGRATEEGTTRWFSRLPDLMGFDQDDIASEAAAFAAFVERAMSAYGLDPERLTVLGYSNGANFAAAAMALHPGLIRRAILLRPVPALDDLPGVDLSGSAVLALNGARDPFGGGADRLNAWFEASGATLTAVALDAAHGLTSEDEGRARDWLA